MAWMIGIDEAGYGPNLGPLAVAASVWWVADEHLEQASATRRVTKRRKSSAQTVGLQSPPSGADLYTLLADAVCQQPDGERIAIADSKLLYKPGTGLAALERAVLLAFREAASWRSLIQAPRVPWYVDFDCPLPVDISAEDLSRCVANFSAVCVTGRAALVEVRVRLVFPREFNTLVEHFGTKGAALSHVTIELLRAVLDDLPLDRAEFPGQNLATITCDKHGGRNHYAALLQHHFSDHWIDTLLESRADSRYAWGPPEERREICFRTSGEALLPVALASMAAKYHRELAMRAFNHFWCAEVPGLRATAGYPLDATRFRREIAARERELGVNEVDLWRIR